MYAGDRLVSSVELPCMYLYDLPVVSEIHIWLGMGYSRRKVDRVLLEASEGFTTGDVALQLSRKRSMSKFSFRTHVQALT